MSFALPEHLEVLHQPVRLAVVTVLHRQPSMTFGELRKSTDVTAGNLASHLDRLAHDGLVRQRRIFGKDGLQTRVLLTPVGAARFQEYLAFLRAYLDGQGARA
ncbi:MAG: transcriptional regulator [Candidatus Thermoplasmatota archaeon]